MKNKFTILLLLISILTSKSYGQEVSQYTGGVTDFINWFSEIDQVLTKISDKEKLKRIYRQLGYASEDIDNIALEKLLFVNEISKLSASNKKDKLDKLKPQASDILMGINNLLDRLESIKADLSQTDQTSIDKSIQVLRVGLTNKNRSYLNIQEYLFGQSDSLSKIKDEAILSKKIAENASIKIKEAKEKIKNKLSTI